MVQRKITFRTGKQISPAAVRAFFKRCQWYDWFTLQDVVHYLKKVLYIATAWHGRKIVGCAALTGDGRNDVFLDSLVVDYAYQRGGIGTALIEMALDKVNKLKPYHFQIQAFDKNTERFYKRFGFVRNDGTWLLEHKPTADKLRAKVKLIREGKDT